jgi:hypothetical protein
MTLRKLIFLGEEFDYLRTLHACFKASSAKLLGNPCPLEGLMRWSLAYWWQKLGS